MITSWERKGRAEGLREGLREGQLLVVEQVLTRRFGALPLLRGRSENRICGIMMATMPF